MKDFGVENRFEFQKKAELFIKKKNGPKLLSYEIKKLIDQNNGINIIDGIRHLDTLKELKKFYPELTVFYVDSTRDDAFRNYIIRSEGNADLAQFREVRIHPVEKEIQMIKYEADAYIFNGGNKSQLFDAFIKWFNSNKR